MYQTALLIFPALMAFAAAYDLITMKIPNWLTATLVLTFPIVALLAGLGWQPILEHVGAGLLLLIVGMDMFAARWMGGGGAKLLAGIGLWFGFGPALIDFLLIAAVAGGALTLALLSMRQFPALPAFTLSWSWLQRLHAKKTGVPYGIALATGALAAYVTSPVAKSMLIAIAG